MSNRRMMQHQTARVFLLDLQDFDDTVYRQFYGAVSSTRRQRADRYYRYEDAKRCVMSEALVQYVYRSVRKDIRPPEIVYPFRGKPYVANDENFHFSVSHTGMFVAVGYAKEEIGIDIEQVNRPLDRKSIAASVFTQEEQRYIFSAPEEQVRLLRFAKLWTAKESYLKYLGRGFGKSPLSFSVDLTDKTIYEKERGTVPGIAVLGRYLPGDYYLTACGNIGKVSIDFMTYRSIMDVILQ